VIVQHTDSTAPLQVAQERGLHGFGQASDMAKFAPKAQYTAIVDNWGHYYVERVKAVLDGTWKPDNVWLGIKDDAVHMSEFSNMSDETKAMAVATEKKIAEGWNPFTGPVAKQDGTPWLKDGEVADDGTLLGMNFYVKGVDDMLPQ
jgi:simple sugar transport system substrate-binding protein